MNFTTTEYVITAVIAILIVLTGLALWISGRGR
jgi:hypothetical protein